MNLHRNWRFNYFIFFFLMVSLRSISLRILVFHTDSRDTLQLVSQHMLFYHLPLKELRRGRFPNNGTCHIQSPSFNIPIGHFKFTPKSSPWHRIQIFIILSLSREYGLEWFSWYYGNVFQSTDFKGINFVTL